MTAHPPLAVLKPHVANALKGQEAGLEKFLVDLFEIAERGGVVSKEQLIRLKEIASNKKELVSNFGRVLLGSLAEHNDDARTAIAEMAHADFAHIRFNAILCLNEKCPDFLVINIITLLIKDKSSKVRCKAADWVRHFKIKALLPVLEQALATESDPKVKQILETEVSMSRTGSYVLRSDPRGNFVVNNSPEGRVIRKVDKDNQ